MFQLKNLPIVLPYMTLLLMILNPEESLQDTQPSGADDFTVRAPRERSLQNTSTTTTTATPTSLVNLIAQTSNITALEHESGAPIADFIRLPEALDADRVLEESSRHFLCFPLLRIFNLELQRPLNPGEHIGLTGSHKRLGEWQLDRSLEMRSLDGQRLEWLAKVPICANERIAYRYFIYTLDAQRAKRIRIWEGQQHARVMESYEIYRQPGVDYFGDTTHPAMDAGGYAGTWLRHERLIELKFIWPRQLRLERQVQPQQPLVRLKLSLLAKRTTAPYMDTWLEVAHYKYNNSRFKPQAAGGVVYQYDGASDVVIFRIFEPLRLRQSYKLSFYAMDRRPIGEVVFWSIDLKRSDGVLQLPVHSIRTGFEVGRLTLPYLIVQPLPHAEFLNMRGSFQHYWPLNWPTMHVGNRGAGQSYYEDEAPFEENTIKSFLHVHKLHGEMVTLDVQLTKDYVPVLWHEFGFYTAPYTRDVQSLLDVDYVLIQDLTYHDLRQRRVFVMKSPTEGLQELTHLNVARLKVLRRIFPRLSAVYQRLPKSLGLIVNIKWSQILRSGHSESGVPNALHKNRYVDTLIATTAQWGCGRPLIFASFDADICTMLKYKQNVYPAIFMSVGHGDTYWREPFRDLRTRSFMNAVNFAQSAQLLGTAMHVANFLKTPNFLDLGTRLLQVNFLWGEELRDVKIVRKFQNLHVTGLIYDRLDLYRPTKQRFEFFAAKELTEIFERSCSSALKNASAGIETKGGSKARRKVVTIHLKI